MTFVEVSSDQDAGTGSHGCCWIIAQYILPVEKAVQY
jgi:hypothetical protein